ncbi:transcription elongation factor NusA [Stetteria hydrogenophila]
MVRIPLDKVCVRTGFLCPACQAKVEKGIVQPWEVDVMRALLEVEDELGPLDFEYVRAERVKGTLYIFVRGAMGAPARVEEALAGKLREKGVRRVRILGEASDPVSAIKVALHPARVLGVNRYYLPDGSVYYVARVPKADRDLLPGRLEDARYLLSKIEGRAGFNVELVDYAEGEPSEPVAIRQESVKSILDKLGI